MATPVTPATVRCAVCGERVRPGRAAGSYTHVARLVAACDLDADHPVTPDWASAGPLSCRTCGESLTPTADGGLTHAGAADRHPPAPVIA